MPGTTMVVSAKSRLLVDPSTVSDYPVALTSIFLSGKVMEREASWPIKPNSLRELNPSSSNKYII